MPVKGRGKVLRTRTRKLPGGKYQRCEVVEKKGPRGGTTVCGPVRKKKSAKRSVRR